MIINGFTGYVRKCKRKEVQVYVTIKQGGLIPRFEESKRATGRLDVFNIIQKKPNTVVHLKIDAAMESRRSYKEVRSR